MTTAREIISLAFRECGVLGIGQTLNAEDTNNGLTLLRRMMAAWQKRRWLVPAYIDISKPGNNNISNTIGTGGYWNVPRPVDIFGGYVLQVNTGPTPVSFPLIKIFSYEDYIKISLKNLNTLPDHFFYDGHFPFGNVFIWPIPSATWEVHLLLPMDLSFPANSLNTVFALPDEYEEAIHYNLSLRLCSMYQRDAGKELVMFARTSLQVIKAGNTQIPQLVMPAALRRQRAISIYNPDGI